jgi:hypothetical protein
MSDLPTFGLIQQVHARPVTGEHLEVLGKQASARWSSGESKTLTEAVVQTVKHAHLSPEQVKRVVEFANQDAYLREFKKEGSDHKFVEFSGGPADPSEILKDLNDGGGGSVYDDGMGDYSTPPAEKRASLEDGLDKIAEAFGADEPLPYADPKAPLVELRDKLAHARNAVADQISGLEVMYADLADQVYGRVKQAALGGATLGEVVQVLSEVAPTVDHMKVAFQLMTPRLLREGVFHSGAEMQASFSKTASSKLVNKEHPLCVDFEEFCETLSKLAELRGAEADCRSALADVEGILAKEGSLADLYGQAGRALKQHGNKAEALVGKGTLAGSAAKHLTQNAHHIGAAYLADQLTGGALSGAAERTVNSFLPGDSVDKQVRQQMGLMSVLKGGYR